MEAYLDRDTLWLGPQVQVTFQRTLRIPEEGEYPLPPGLGSFPLRRVDDYADRVPASWRRRGGVMLPMYQREAMWLSFDAPHWHPHALAVGVGKVNAVSGRAWSEELSDDPQSYVVVPDQPWLDGINAGDGFIRQFVAMPLGQGATVEAQVTGAETEGGIQLLCLAPEPGRFPDEPPPDIDVGVVYSMAPMAATVSEMGLGAGGRMRQKIYPDPHGIDTWGSDDRARVFVHLADSMMWRQITGEEPPPTPVTAATYRAPRPAVVRALRRRPGRRRLARCPVRRQADLGDRRRQAHLTAAGRPGGRHPRPPDRPPRPPTSPPGPAVGRHRLVAGPTVAGPTRRSGPPTC